MSTATKRKHVFEETLSNTYKIPEENQSIVKILAGKGNNLHLVENDVGEEFLVSMPSKFRYNVWIKKGDYVLVDPIVEGNRVKGEICSILNKNNIRYLKSQNLWPKSFNYVEESASNNDNMDNLFLNPNKINLINCEDCDDDSDSCD